jgi:hypothetical protein
MCTIKCESEFLSLNSHVLLHINKIMFMQQGNLLHFSVMLHDLCFIFHQILWIDIDLSLWCQCWQKPDFKRDFFSTKENYGARGGVVVKALRYKPAGHGFHSRCFRWYFSIIVIEIYFTFQRSMIGNKTLGHRTSHNTCNSYICNATYNCFIKIKTCY